MERKGIEPSTSRMPSAKSVRLKSLKTTVLMWFPDVMIFGECLHVNAQKCERFRHSVGVLQNVLQNGGGVEVIVGVFGLPMKCPRERIASRLARPGR